MPEHVKDFHWGKQKRNHGPANCTYNLFRFSCEPFNGPHPIYLIATIPLEATFQIGVNKHR